LQDEATIGTSDLGGANAPISDFLMASTHFTVIVEVKRPDTPLFRAAHRKNRANAWALAPELTDAVSQILEQKASWEKKAAIGADHFLKSGNRLHQKTVDPKCLLIIGANDAFNGTEQEADIKLRTFELYRRDSRNIEIITYSELYERAEFIVSHPSPKSPPESPSVVAIPDDYDIPF
jgi:hypothetical protein